MLVLLIGIFSQFFLKFFSLLSWKLPHSFVEWVIVVSLVRQIKSKPFIISSSAYLENCDIAIVEIWHWVTFCDIEFQNNLKFPLLLFWKNLTLLVWLFPASTVWRQKFQIHFVISVFALSENNHVDILTLDVRTTFSA